MCNDFSISVAYVVWSLYTLARQVWYRCDPHMHACNQASHIHCLDLAMLEKTWYKLACCLWIQWKTCLFSLSEHCSSLGRHVVHCRRFKSRFCMILLMHATSASTTEQCRVTSTQVAYRRSKFSVCFCLPRNLWPGWRLADSLQIWSSLAPEQTQADAFQCIAQPNTTLLECILCRMQYPYDPGTLPSSAG